MKMTTRPVVASEVLVSTVSCPLWPAAVFLPLFATLPFALPYVSVCSPQHYPSINSVGLHSKPLVQLVFVFSISYIFISRFYSIYLFFFKKIIQKFFLIIINKPPVGTIPPFRIRQSSKKNLSSPL